MFVDSLKIALDPLKFLSQIIDLASDKVKHEKMVKVLRGMLSRELTTNLTLLGEVGNLMNRKNEPLDCNDTNKILKYLRHGFFDLTVTSGIPIEEIVPGASSIDESSEFYSRLRNIKTAAELVEKAYNRTIMQKIYSEEGISKRNDSLGYTIALCRLARDHILRAR